VDSIIIESIDKEDEVSVHKGSFTERMVEEASEARRKTPIPWSSKLKMMSESVLKSLANMGSNNIYIIFLSNLSS